MEKEEHIKYGPDSTSQMEKESEEDREREKKAEKEKKEGERKTWRERNARNIENKSARGCKEQDREEGEHNVNKIIYLYLRLLIKCSTF